MIRVFSAIALMAIVSCGVDGEPLQPTANLGIGIGSSGVHAGGTIGVSQGPISVGVGVF